MTSQQRAMRRFNVRQRLHDAERRLVALERERERQATVVDDTDYGWHRRRYLPTAITTAMTNIVLLKAELSWIGEGRGYTRRRAA